jgi:hypothetical protein
LGAILTATVNVLRLVPEIAAIGQLELQGYCDAWLCRPIARKFGVAQLVVDYNLMLTVNLDANRVQYVGENASMRASGVASSSTSCVPIQLTDRWRNSVRRILEYVGLTKFSRTTAAGACQTEYEDEFSKRQKRLILGMTF